MKKENNKPADSFEAEIMKAEEESNKTTFGTNLSTVKKYCQSCPNQNQCPFVGVAYSTREGLCLTMSLLKDPCISLSAEASICHVKLKKGQYLEIPEDTVDWNLRLIEFIFEHEN